MSSYDGHLPYLDEGQERIDNAEHLQVGTVGMKLVSLVDQSGVAVTLTSIPTTCGDGRKLVTVAGTAEQFASQACKYCIIVGLPGNTNGIVIGGSTVVAATAGRRGVVLYAEQSQRFDVTNMNALYIDAITNGEGVAFAYFN